MPLRRLHDIRILLLSIAVLITCSVLAAQTLPQGVTKGPSMAGITEYTYLNGLRVLLLPDSGSSTITVNIVYLVGNSPLRIAAVGWDERPATAAELADMQALLREAMEEGAWGLSTGLDYPPGNYADTAELVELSRVGARLGGIYLPERRIRTICSIQVRDARAARSHRLLSARRN